MTDDGWINEPKAIDTLVALGGLQPGDEIVLNKNIAGGIAHMNMRHGGIYTIAVRRPSWDKYGKYAYWGGAPEEIILGVIEDRAQVHLNYFTRSNISAWRRPLTHQQPRKERT